MKILKILPYFPGPPFTGGRIRSLNILKHLSKKHSVELVCFCKPGEEDKLGIINPFCEKVYPISRPGSPTQNQILSLALSNRPMYVQFHLETDVRNVLREVISIASTDVIHVETYYLMPALPKIENIPTVLVEPNIEYMLMEQVACFETRLFWKLIWSFDAFKQKRWEKRIWHSAARCAGVTHEDAAVITKEVGYSVDVVENGIDPQVRRVNYDEATTPSLLFVGNFLYRPNIDGIAYFIEEIYPIILRKFPDTQLHIVGDCPLITSFKRKNIKIWGYLENLDSIFDRTQVSICPLRIGSGSRIKVLDAIARGHPLVSTSVGCAGLRLNHEAELLVADEPRDFAEATCKLLASPKQRRAIGTRARKTAIKNYSWELIVSSLVDCYDAAITDFYKKPR